MKNFTDSLIENLLGDVEKHDTLNPKLWNEDNTLKPEVEEKINAIVDNFLDDLKENDIKINVKDIKLVGSNCSYNYNDKSDLDVHIVADTDSLGCPDNLYPLLYSAYRSIWNKNHDVEFYGIPVELFVETSDTKQENEEPKEEINESLKESVESSVDFLIKDEEEAVAGYEKAQKDIQDDKKYDADALGDIWDELEHIRAEEEEHIEELNQLKKDYIGEELTEARQQTALKSNGIYSVMNHAWIKEPVAEDIPELDQEAFDTLLAEWEPKFEEAKNSGDVETIEKFIEDIYDLRKAGIAESEFDIKNLVFKELRNRGCLDELKEIKNNLVTKELSLESLNEDLVFDYTKDDIEKMFKLVQEETDKDKAKYLRDILNKGLFELYTGEKGDGLDDWRENRWVEITDWLKAHPLKEELTEDFKIYDEDFFTELTEKEAEFKDKIKKVIENYNSEKTSKIHWFEDEESFPCGIRRITDEEKKNMGFAEDEEVLDYFVFYITGGLNGSGSWEDYFKDLSDLFKELKKECGSEPWVLEVDNDCPDDVWNIRMGINMSEDKAKHESLENALKPIKEKYINLSTNTILDEMISNKDRYELRNKITRLANGNQPIIYDNGRFTIHNVKQSDVDRIVNRLRMEDFIESVSSFAGRYDFSRPPMLPGQLPDKYFTIEGTIKE